MTIKCCQQQLSYKKISVVIIDDIDEYGHPWFTVRFKDDEDNGCHTIAIMEDESWEIVHQVSSQEAPPKEHKIAMIKKQIEDTLEQYDEEFSLPLQ